MSKKVFNCELIWLLLRLLTACQMKPEGRRLEGKMVRHAERVCPSQVECGEDPATDTLTVSYTAPCTSVTAPTLPPFLSYLLSLTSLSPSIHLSVPVLRSQ